MLKKILYSFSFIIFLTIDCQPLLAQYNEKSLICSTGFEFQISQNPNWGYGEPVITRIIPESAAEKAGLRENDIIMEIDSKATFLRDIELLEKWLSENANRKELRLTIRNINNSFIEKRIIKDCKTINTISEKDISSICSSYSPENVRVEEFTMPIKIKTLNKKNFDYSDFHTFDFLPSDSELHPLVKKIIARTLENLGMKQSNKNPDIYIDCRYSLEAEDKKRNIACPNVIETRCDGNKKRYNFETENIEILPIADEKTSRSLYSFDIKISILEDKIINPTILTKIWEAELQEDFTSKISLKKILDMYVPLIIMQYPFTEDCTSVTFEVDFQNYLYTGISYENNNLNKIISIDKNSPAEIAGLKAGNIIEKIQNKAVSGNLNDLMQSVKFFTVNTISLRDQEKCFGIYENIPYNYLWDKRKESEIRKSFDNKRYKTVFSYLFDFEKYINPNYDGVLDFDIVSENGDYTVQIKPILKKNNRIRIIR